MVRTVFALVMLMFVASSASAKGLKIGVVNLQRAVAESKDGKKAQQQLSRLKKKREKELNEKLKSFYAEEKKLREAWAVLKDAERRKRAQAAQARMQGLQKEYMTAERDLAQRQARAMMKISKQLNGIIQQIAKRDKYDYIFDNAAVLWAPNHVDLTNEVIRRYNRK